MGSTICAESSLVEKESLIKFPSAFKELSESESKSNFKFSILVSLIDKSMFVLVLIDSKFLKFSHILCTFE